MAVEAVAQANDRVVRAGKAVDAAGRLQDSVAKLWYSQRNLKDSSERKSRIQAEIKQQATSMGKTETDLAACRRQRAADAKELAHSRRRRKQLIARAEATRAKTAAAIIDCRAF